MIRACFIDISMANIHMRMLYCIIIRAPLLKMEVEICVGCCCVLFVVVVLFVVCLVGGARLRILFDQKRCPRGLRCFAQIAEQGLNLSGS